jgi:hypothetical protein
MDEGGIPTALVRVGAQWWVVGLGIATVLGAYFQLRNDVSVMRVAHQSEVAELRAKIERLERWVKDPHEFPGIDVPTNVHDAGTGSVDAGNAGTKDAGTPRSSSLPPPGWSPTTSWSPPGITAPLPFSAPGSRSTSSSRDIPPLPSSAP